MLLIVTIYTLGPNIALWQDACDGPPTARTSLPRAVFQPIGSWQAWVYAGMHKTDRGMFFEAVTLAVLWDVFNYGILYEKAIERRAGVRVGSRCSFLFKNVLIPT